MVHTKAQNHRAPQVLPGSFHSLQRGVFFNATIRSLVLSVAELQCTGLDRTGKHPYCQWGWGPAAQRDKHTEGKRNKERRGGRAPEEEHNKGRREKKGRWRKMRRPDTGWNRSQVVFFPSSLPSSILILFCIFWNQKDVLYFHSFNACNIWCSFRFLSVSLFNQIWLESVDNGQVAIIAMYSLGPVYYLQPIHDICIYIWSQNQSIDIFWEICDRNMMM